MSGVRVEMGSVMVAVFAAVSTEARVGVRVGIVGMCWWLVVVVLVRRLDGDLHCHWLLVKDGNGNVLLVDDRTIDRNVDWVANGFFDDIWNLIE